MAIVTFVFDGDKLTEIHHQWMFDDFFSSYLLGEFNRNGNDILEPEEQAALQANAFSNLREFGYFSHLRQGDSPLALGDAKDFSARLQKGAIIYSFSLPLRKPVATAEQPVVLGVYDQSYYVDVMLDEDDPVRFQGIASGMCHYKLRDDRTKAFYFNLVVPKGITVNCSPG